MSAQHHRLDVGDVVHPLLRHQEDDRPAGLSEAEEIAGLDIFEHGSPGYGEGFGSFEVPADHSMMVSPVDETVA